MKVKCIDKAMNSFITLDKIYEASLRTENSYYIRNDLGKDSYYPSHLFELQQFHVVALGGLTFYDEGSTYEVHSETENEYFLVNKLGVREWMSKKHFTLLNPPSEVNIFKTEIKKETVVVEEKKYHVLCGGEEVTIDIDTKFTKAEAVEEIKRLAEEDMREYSNYDNTYYIVEVVDAFHTEVTTRKVYDVEMRKL